MKIVQIKFHCSEQLKNGEAFGVRWLDTAFPNLSVSQLEGESCVKPQHSKIEPKIIIKKSQRILELYSNGKLVRSYKIALGSNPNEDKQIEGDGATPLGEFFISTKNDKSKFYLSLGLSYPNIEDAERGLREGLITQEEHDAIIKAIAEKKMPPQNTKLGGEIYIHGGTTGAITDWTQGCVALRNEDIKELFDAIPVQTLVVIEP